MGVWCFYLQINACGCKASEPLVDIEQDPTKFTPSNTIFQCGNSSTRRKYCTHKITVTLIAGVSYVAMPVMEDDELVDSDFHLLAKSYFDYREYKRVVHVLCDQTERRSMFLHCYTLSSIYYRAEVLSQWSPRISKANDQNRQYHQRMLLIPWTMTFLC